MLQEEKREVNWDHERIPCDYVQSNESRRSEPARSGLALLFPLLHLGTYLALLLARSTRVLILVVEIPTMMKMVLLIRVEKRLGRYHSVLPTMRKFPFSHLSRRDGDLLQHSDQNAFFSRLALSFFQDVHT